MEPCDKPLAEMGFCEAVSCVYDKGAKAVSAVIDAPGAASITDWAFALLAALVAAHLLALLIRSLTPRRPPPHAMAGPE
jgi:hypothetical protein